MAYTPKTWIDLPSNATPANAAALNDLETRLNWVGSVRTITTNTTLTASDNVVLADATGQLPVQGTVNNLAIRATVQGSGGNFGNSGFAPTRSNTSGSGGTSNI